MSPVHRQFIDLWFHLLRPHSTLLYAAFGTGQYWSLLLAHEYSLVGIDPSEESLMRAREKYPKIDLARARLQEVRFQEAFDGVLCGATREIASPEHGPVILMNFQRAIKSAGYLYFAVELAEETEPEDAISIGRHKGSSILADERPRSSGFCYTPMIGQIQGWIHRAGLQIVDDSEADRQHLFLVRKGHELS